MSRYSSILLEFNDIIADLAHVWEEQYGQYNDKKIEMFGMNIIRPISVAGAKINEQSDNLLNCLKRLSELDILRDF